MSQYENIFMDYPNAGKMLRIWDARVLLDEWPSRKMYDFFDSKMIELGVQPSEGNYLKFEAKIVVSNRSHQKLCTIDNIQDGSRQELESKAFMKAFDILEQRIKNGDYD